MEPQDFLKHVLLNSIPHNDKRWKGLYGQISRRNTALNKSNKCIYWGASPRPTEVQIEKIEQGAALTVRFDNKVSLYAHVPGEVFRSNQLKINFEDLILSERVELNS